MTKSSRGIASGSRGRRFLERGESMVASAGLGAAVVLLGAMGASAWWTADSQRRVLGAAREQQLLTVATMLGKAVEGMLAADEASALQRVVANAARTYGLERCAVSLPDGRVLVDASSSEPAAVPERWSAPGGAGPAAAGEQKIESHGEGGLKVVSSLWVPKRGPVTLEMVDTDVAGMAGAGGANGGLGAGVGGGWGRWRVQAGLSAIGAVSLTALLFTYRRMRSRLRALGAIGEALSAVEAGESGVEALRVSADLGPAAGAWNKLLSERERLKDKDLSERAQEELSTRRGRDSEVGSACDALWQGVLLVDERMRTRYANGAAGVFLQAKRDDMIGQELGAFVKDAAALGVIRGVVSGQTKQRAVVEVERNSEQGGGTLRFSVRPIRKEDHGRAVVVVEDVTQQKVADAARNSFVAQATHELRTPLTNIRLYVDSMIEDGDEDATKRATALNVIAQESRRLERIVGDMLSVAEIEAGQMKLQEGDVRIEPLFGEMESDFREQARHKEINLRMEMDPKLPVIRGDRDKLTLAVHNLVGNAIKYTPAGGEVSVRVRQTGGELLVDVKDNGIGIKQEEQGKIFDRFYRARDKRIAGITGTGLGLALAREVARMHGGDVTVDSQVDKGSTFTLRLPAQLPRAAA